MRKDASSKTGKCKEKRQIITSAQCNDHKEVVEFGKSIPLVIQSLDQLKDQISGLSTDIKEIFRIIRTHEGQIQHIAGKLDK